MFKFKNYIALKPLKRIPLDGTGRVLFNNIICIYLILFAISNIIPTSSEEILNLHSGIILFCLLFNIASADISEMQIQKTTCITGIILGVLINCFEIAYYQKSHNFILILISYQFFSIITTLISIDCFSRVAKKLTNKDLLGLGDAKLAAMGAAWLGGNGILLAMGAACLLTGTFSLIGRLLGKLKAFQPIPFAPFIAIGIWSVWINGTNLGFYQ